MADNKVNQKLNYVEGDMAGRDIRKTIINHSGDAYQTSAYMLSLIDRFKSGEEEDITEYVDNLKHFMMSVDGELKSDLESKLSAGGRDDIVKYALRVKDQFTKKLLSVEHSESAQEIMANLLGIIVSVYARNIYPAVMNGDSQEQVNVLIDEYVIRRIEVELGENVLRILRNEIDGMLYFLTGNCHIEWK